MAELKIGDMVIHALPENVTIGGLTGVPCTVEAVDGTIARLVYRPEGGEPVVFKGVDVSGYVTLELPENLKLGGPEILNDSTYRHPNPEDDK